MRIPLYDGLPKAPLYDEPAVPNAADCERCPLGALAPAGSRCIGAYGESGGLYVLGGAPTYHEVQMRTPMSSGFGIAVKTAVAKSWSGPVVWDAAIRCAPGEDKADTKEAVDRCRVYTRHAIATTNPSRVLCVGRDAARSIIGGDNLPDNSIDHVQRGYYWLEMPSRKPIPVFLMHDVAPVMSNTVLMRQWEASIAWCLSVDVADLEPHPATTGIEVAIIETPADVRVALDDLGNGPLSFDVETDGELGNDDFRIISLAVYRPGSRVAHVWVGAALTSRELVGPIVQLLARPDVTKIAQNGKFDLTAMQATFKVPIDGPLYDTMLVQRLRHVDRMASLDHLSFLVGQGGYKAEVGRLQDAAKKQMKLVDKAQKRKRPAKFNWGAYTNKYIPLLDLVRYNARDVVVTASVRKVQRTWFADGGKRAACAAHAWNSVQGLASQCAANMERIGVYIDKQRMASNAVEFENRRVALESRLVGVNPNSAPQMQAKLYGDKASGGFGLSVPGNRTTDGGAPSADEVTLGMILERYGINASTTPEEVERILARSAPANFIQAVLDTRSLVKLDGTYVTGLARHIRGDNRIHPSMTIDGTETGRMSMRDPNLYNIPRAETADGRLVKDQFCAQPDAPTLAGDPLDPVVLVQADYSQLELRIAAWLSGDQKMTGIFNSGVDYHMRTAEMLAARGAWGLSAAKWAIMEAEYLSALAQYRDAKLRSDHSAEEPKDPRKKYRSMCKAVNFGLLYGKGDAALAVDMGGTVAEAAQVRAAILGAFTDLDIWCKARVAYARANGGVWTRWANQDARWRPLPDIGSSQEFRRLEAERAAINTPVQGSASDFTLSSLIVLERMLRSQRLPARPVLSVYDSIIFESRRSFVPELVSLTKEVMENMWDSGDVPLVADFDVADGEARWGSTVDYANWSM